MAYEYECDNCTKLFETKPQTCPECGSDRIGFYFSDDDLTAERNEQAEEDRLTELYYEQQENQRAQARSQTMPIMDALLWAYYGITKGKSTKGLRIRAGVSLFYGIEASFITINRWSDKETDSAGFRNIMFKSTPVILDRDLSEWCFKFEWPDEPVDDGSLEGEDQV